MSRDLVTTSRLLCTITAVAYPAFWFVDAAVGAPLQDPLALRLAVAALCAAIWLGTYRSEWVRAHLRQLMLVIVYFITANAYFLVGANALEQSMVVGTFVVLTGFLATSAYTVSRVSDIAAYLVFSNAAALIGVLLTDQPQTQPAYYLLSVATVSGLTFVAARGQFRTSERLAESQQQLRRDVEVRKRTELALRASEAEATALVDAMPDLMIRVDTDGTIQSVLGGAPGALRSFLCDALGQSICECVRAGAGREALTAALCKARASRATQTVEASVLLANGEVRELSIPLAAIDDEHVLLLIRDVTDAMAMDAQLRIRDRLISLGTLASGVGHEINNPLTYVYGNLVWVGEELRRRLGVNAHQDLQAALDEARGGSERIRDIVLDLQQHSRGDSDALEPVDIGTTILSALRMMENQLKHCAVVEVSMANLPPAHANSSRLHQVIINLIGNALQAFPERPPSENRIHVRTALLSDGRLSILVSDNGHGIPPEILPRVFDPFFTTKMPGVGTGLGLYLCHKFVVGFGAELLVESEPGMGTTFRILLRPTERAQAPQQPHQASSSECLRILVIDDEPLVARAVARMLRPHEVDVVHDAAEALRMCAARDYAFLLCDLMMPGCDGPTLHARLAEQHPELVDRIAFMSGGAFTPQANRFLEAVPNPCNAKPIDRQQLQQTLAQVTTLPRPMPVAMRAVPSLTPSMAPAG